MLSELLEKIRQEGWTVGKEEIEGKEHYILSHPLPSKHTFSVTISVNNNKKSFIESLKFIHTNFDALEDAASISNDAEQRDIDYFKRTLLCLIVQLCADEYEEQKDHEAELRKRIKYLRQDEHHMTQEQVAKKLGITRTAYTKLETSGQGINASKLIKLCRIFHVDANYLLLGVKTK